MEITRKYAHKTFGYIGQVSVQFPSEGWTLEGKELPEKAVRHFGNFMLQSLQDAYAGAENAADAVGRWGKKLDRIIAGKVGVRVSAASDPFEAECLRIARAVIDTHARENGLKLSKEQRAGLVADYRETYSEDIEAEAEANLSAVQGKAEGLEDLFAKVLGEPAEDEASDEAE